MEQYDGWKDDLRIIPWNLHYGYKTCPIEKGPLRTEELGIGTIMIG